jgi:HNH endonuclease
MVVHAVGTADQMSTKHDQLHRLGNGARWRCYHCGCRVWCRTCDPNKINRHAATRDHLVARALGGRGGENLVLSCFACNQKKAARPIGVPKPKSSRSTDGCMREHNGGGRKPRRPRTAFPTESAAIAMCTAVETTYGKPLEPYLCEKCSNWHIRATRRNADGDVISA